MKKALMVSIVGSAAASSAFAYILIVLTAVLVSSSALADEVCSPVRNCVGTHWTVNADRSWTKVEDGQSHPVPKDQKFCEGAFYPSPGVEFSTGVEFVVNIVTANPEQQKVLGADAKVVLGTFMEKNSSGGSVIGMASVAPDSKYFGATAFEGKHVYSVVCGEK